MREDFIHFLWKFKLLLSVDMKTTAGQSLVVKSLGQHNHHSGPDFFNGRVVIDGQEWAGNIEMHVNSRDWFLHNHDTDSAYDNVILHVVWNHDFEIRNKDGHHIPVLEIKSLIPENLLVNFHKLFTQSEEQFINCKNQIQQVDDFKKSMWLEKVFIERLQAKSARIASYLEVNQNDWEAAFFQALARSFGSKVNADAFENLTQSIPIQTIRKLARDAFQLESVLLGQLGLLEEKKIDRYFQLCLDEYAFAKAKYQLTLSSIPAKLFRLRPANYPTIRLSQLAQLYHRNPMLFGEVLLAKTKSELYKIFEVKAATYWNNHHLFDKQVEEREKHLTTNFIDLIIINCIVPFKFHHAAQTGKDITEELLELMQEIKPEKNKIVLGFKGLYEINSALESQAVLQLKSNYCDLNKCLSCDVGVALLRS
jgi:hypothetical protein